MKIVYDERDLLEMIINSQQTREMMKSLGFTHWSGRIAFDMEEHFEGIEIEPTAPEETSNDK